MNLVKKSRFLILTEDLLTWKFDRPILFEGEWVRKPYFEQFLNKLDYEVLQPLNNEGPNKDKAFENIKIIENKYFNYVVTNLNQINGTNHSSRFWKILIGHWFRRYISLMINRYNTIINVLNNYNVSGAAFYPENLETLITKNSLDFILISKDNNWNLQIYLLILKYMNYNRDIKIEFINISKDNSELLHEKKNESIAYLKKDSGFLNILFNKVLKYLDSNSSIFIINSYLSFKIDIFIQLYFWKIPQIRKSSVNIELPSCNLQYRSELKKKYYINSDVVLEEVIINSIFDFIPICYLEGFINLKAKMKDLKWPTKPKFIFTSNSFDTDELFKIYTALNIERGIKYFVGQHGNNYGTNKFLGLSIEQETADKFITWGWKNNFNNHIAGFIFKRSLNFIKRNINGKFLLILVCPEHPIYPFDTNYEYYHYLIYQKKFLLNLDINIQNNLIVRLHLGSVDYSWDEKKMFSEINPNIIIDIGRKSIYKLIESCKLVIHGYDSTGILETLSANIPSIAFWDKGFDHLSESAIPYYKILYDAGIIYFDSKAAADKLNEIGEDVEAWWQRSEVQNARILFCENYARISKNPVNDLKNILKD
jgi:putative transferase (TIGR04331 family)